MLKVGFTGKRTLRHKCAARRLLRKRMSICGGGVRKAGLGRGRSWIVCSHDKGLSSSHGELWSWNGFQNYLKLRQGGRAFILSYWPVMRCKITSGKGGDLHEIIFVQGQIPRRDSIGSHQLANTAGSWENECFSPEMEKEAIWVADQNICYTNPRQPVSSLTHLSYQPNDATLDTGGLCNKRRS